MPVNDEIYRIISETLEIDPSRLTDELSFWDVPSWTSLRHVELLVKLEAALGVRFDAEQASSSLDIGAVLALASAAGDPGRRPAAPGAVTEESVVDEVASWPLTAGAVLLVHSSFESLGPVDGGPLALIRGFLRGLQPHGGTLVMPAMTGRRRRSFDRSTSHTDDMGLLAETFLRHPGAHRSDHPTSSFAALGPAAAEITGQHPLDRPEGPDGPMGRMHDLDAWVLLLGVGHDADTSLHLAEYLADVPYQRRVPVFHGLPGEMTAIPHCASGFARIAPLLEGGVAPVRLGRAEGELIRMRRIVQTGQDVLARDPRHFLCDPGNCPECDLCQ